MNPERERTKGFSLSKPVFQTRNVSPVQAPAAVSCAAENSWKTILSQMTEVSFPSPSHIYAAGNKLTSISRVFASAPRSSLLFMKQEAGIIKDPL